MTIVMHAITMVLPELPGRSAVRYLLLHQRYGLVAGETTLIPMNAEAALQPQNRARMARN